MTISLDIFSDPICPWCAIGKARLDRAEAQHGAPVFARRWRVFQLNPHMPPEGVDRRAYLEAKFGGPEGAQRIYGAIAETAEQEGLRFKFDMISRTPSTLDAHRVLRWAAAVDGQDAVMDSLFDFYFRHGADISDHDVLIDAAAAGGLEKDVTRRLLAGDSDREEALAEDATAREMGVNGAPTFVIDGRHVAPGAVGSDVWLRVIHDLAPSAPGSTA
ncbi:MAG: DsbA family oxidoreductase [Neomegalonema sp.]|nr:DsbA family oxidoreductase [Neomegalonema sp.]